VNKNSWETQILIVVVISRKNLPFLGQLYVNLKQNVSVLILKSVLCYFDLEDDIMCCDINNQQCLIV
jgi:hypothetical protein